MVRYIGIRHRVKKTAEGESRPTMVCVLLPDASPVRYELATEQDELDFLLGNFPVEFDDPNYEEGLHGIPAHQIKWRKAKDKDDLSVIPEAFRRNSGTSTKPIIEIVSKVPVRHTGLMVGDVVGIMLGGSGDRFAFALSRQSEKLGEGTRVMRIPSAVAKDTRGHEKTDDDDQFLAELVRDRSELFRECTVRDRQLIRLTEAYRARIDAMKARIACEQRLRQRKIGEIFCNEEGLYPEGGVEDAFDALKASDPIRTALLAEESLCEKEVLKVLKTLDVYNELFVPINGVGPSIASRIIVAIGDIRRFPNDAKLKAFLGVHVMQGGRFGNRSAGTQFVRRRSGEVANYHPDGRQALYLLSDQFNRRSQTPWGMKLLEYKAKLRAKHPAIECSVCQIDIEHCPAHAEGSTLSMSAKAKHTRRYGDGHIHKMAMWRTVTKFVEWLFREWWKIEKRVAAETVAKSEAT